MQMENQVLQVNIDDIIPNRFQPRVAFDEKGLNELSASIKEHGIIQPLVLRKLGDKYEIIAGERRYKAATMAGLTTVPAVISNIDDNKSAEVALVENIQRRDLTPIEEARSYKNLLDKGYLTQEELAKKMGLSQSTIANKLRLLSLDDSVQQALLEAKISERHARALLVLDDKQEQAKWLDRIINERLTVRQLDQELKKVGNNMPENHDVPLVNLNPNLEEMQNNAQDINPEKTQSVESMMVPQESMVEYPQQEAAPAAPVNPFDTAAPQEPVAQPEMQAPVQDPFAPTPGPVPTMEPAPDAQPQDPFAAQAPDAITEPTPAQTPVEEAAPQENVQPEAPADLFNQTQTIPDSANKFFNALESEPAAMDANNAFAPDATFSTEAPANSDEIEIFDMPVTPQAPIIEEEPAPAAQPMTSDAPELNPNNKFFQPGLAEEPVAQDAPQQQEELVNPMNLVDSLEQAQPEVQQQASSNSLNTSIQQVRDLVSNLANQGVKIKLDEADLATLYQLNIIIEKD